MVFRSAIRLRRSSDLGRERPRDVEPSPVRVRVAGPRMVPGRRPYFRAGMVAFARDSYPASLEALLMAD